MWRPGWGSRSSHPSLADVALTRCLGPARARKAHEPINRLIWPPGPPRALGRAAPPAARPSSPDAARARFSPTPRSSSRRALVVRNSGGGKIDVRESGLNSVENEVVRNNLMGRSRYMSKKGWVDAQGRKVRT